MERRRETSGGKPPFLRAGLRGMREHRRKGITQWTGTAWRGAERGVAPASSRIFMQADGFIFLLIKLTNCSIILYRLILRVNDSDFSIAIGKKRKHTRRNQT